MERKAPFSFSGESCLLRPSTPPTVPALHRSHFYLDTLRWTSPYWGFVTQGACCGGFELFSFLGPPIPLLLLTVLMF